MFSLISLLTESWSTAAYKPIAKSRTGWLIQIVTSKGTFVIKSMKIANMFTVRIQRLDLKASKYYKSPAVWIANSYQVVFLNQNEDHWIQGGLVITWMKWKRGSHSCHLRENQQDAYSML